MKPLKEELTTAMHNEFTIDSETELKHRCMSLLTLVNGNLKDKDIESYFVMYNVNRKDVEAWIEYFKELRSK